jgi:hypothetical protein
MSIKSFSYNERTQQKRNKIKLFCWQSPTVKYVGSNAKLEQESCVNMSFERDKKFILVSLLYKIITTVSIDFVLPVGKKLLLDFCLIVYANTRYQST